MRFGKEKKPLSARERLGLLIPALELEDVKNVLFTDLHFEVPDSKQETLLYYTETQFRIYRDGKNVLGLPLSEISELRLQKGVGCISIEYTEKASQNQNSSL